MIGCSSQAYGLEPGQQDRADESGQSARSPSVGLDGLGGDAEGP